MVVVAAVDHGTTDSHVVEEAARLAGAFGEEVHVVHALTFDEIREHFQAADEEERRRTAKERAAAVAEEAASSAGTDFEPVPVGRLGDPATEVADYASSVDARYVVLGGRRRSPVGKALFGSVTQEVLLNADRPVVTLIREEDGR